MRDHEAFWLVDGDAGRRLTTYRHIRKLLTDHPDLRPLYDERTRAAFARPYDRARLERARASWDEALDQRGIRLKFSAPGVGFGAGHSLPDADEPGFDPIDLHQSPPWEKPV